MSLVRVQSFSISLDGFGTGEGAAMPSTAVPRAEAAALMARALSSVKALRL